MTYTVVHGSDQLAQISDRRPRGSRAAYVLSSVVAIASLVASVAGLTIKDLYQDGSSWATAALRGGDLVTLAAVHGHQRRWDRRSAGSSSALVGDPAHLEPRPVRPCVGPAGTEVTVSVGRLAHDPDPALIIQDWAWTSRP